MRRPLLLGLALAVLACLPAPAMADFLVQEPDAGRVLRVTSAPFTVTGQLTVTYAADPATCAAAGRCGESGTVVWRPQREGVLRLSDLARRAGRRTEGSLFFVGAFDFPPDVFAQTRRGERRCSDAGNALSELEIEVRGTEALLGLAPQGRGPIASRCGGPVWSDARDALPRVRVPLATLRRRGALADLRGSHRFVAGGLAGTAESTVVLRIGRSRRAVNDGPSDLDVPGEKPVEVADFRVRTLGGAVRATVRGIGAEQLCAPLDACGLGGTVTLTPQPRDGRLRVVRQPGALAGSGGWLDDGTVAATIGRGDGSDPCVDTAPLPAGFLLVDGERPDGGTLIGYEPFGAASRCPGPLPGNTFLDASAYGVVPRGAFDSGRPITVRLDRGVDRTRGGFRVSTTSDLVLRLTPIRR